MSRRPATPDYRLEATFTFVDMAGYTALAEAHGDEAAADVVERLIRLVGEAITGCEGAALLEVIGDAALIRCPAPASAIPLVGALFRSAAAEPGFPVLRAGVHHGPVLARGDRFYGSTINLAARVTAQARGGQVLCTGEVAAAAGGAGAGIRSLGFHKLRNLSEPVEIFELVLDGVAGDAVIDPVCRMQVDPGSAAGTLNHDGRGYWFCSLRCAAAFAARPADFAVPDGHG